MAGLFPLFAPQGNNKKAQINLGAGDVTSQTFINLFNAQNFTMSGGATPAALDADFYPVRNFTGLISGNPYYVVTTLSTTGPWIFKWDAGRGNFKINFGRPATVSVVTGSPTVTNGGGSGNLSITNTGSAGSVSITWNDTVAPSIQFDGSYGSWSSNTTGAMALYRSSDATDYAAGKYWTPEFITLVNGLNARSIRPMGLNILRQGSQDTNESKWSYRRGPNALTFVTDGFPPGARAGGAASFGTVAWNSATGVFTAAASDDTTAGAWNNGDCIVGTNDTQAAPITISGAAAKTGANAGKVQLTVNSTTGLVVSNTIQVSFVNGTTEANGRQTILSVDSSTTVTIDVVFVNAFASSPYSAIGYQRLAITGKTGTKLIFSNYCIPVGPGGDRTDQQNILTGSATYFYDSILDAVVYTSGGISQAWAPIEAQIQLANTLSVNYWYNAPTFANDDYITQSANLIYGLLTSPLKLMYEYTNEPWNFGQPASRCMDARGTALGLSDDRDYTALRVRQINGNLLPVSNWSSAMGRLDRLFMTQGASSPSDLGVLSYLDGTNLSAYGYNATGQRPVDVSDTIGYAPYLGGGTALSGQSVDVGSTAPTAGDAAVLQAIANAQNTGDTATAYALIDDCIKWGRRGVQTVTASGTTFTTPLAHGFSVGDFLRLSVAGGTTYSGLDVLKLYRVLSTPLSTTFTAGEVVANNLSAAVNAGSAGSGTTSVGFVGTNGQESIFTITHTFFTKWEYIANYFNTSRASVGLPPLKVQWYEGAPEFTAPTAAQCATISVTVSGSSVTAASLIDAAVTGYKNNTMASLIIQKYCKAFVGTDADFGNYGAMSHSVAVAQLVLLGGGIYGLVADSNVTNPAKYKTYDGFATFSAS